MIITYSSQFVKDLRKLSQSQTKIKVEHLIRDLETVSSLGGIAHVKKISGFKGYYRIRFGNYRVGLKLTNQKIELLRCLHRKDLYKVFP